MCNSRFPNKHLKQKCLKILGKYKIAQITQIQYHLIPNGTETQLNLNMPLENNRRNYKANTC